MLKTWYFSYSAFWSAGQWGTIDPLWLRYCFNEALCTISSITPIRVDFFPFLVCVESLENRRHYACEKSLCRANNQDHAFHQIMHCSHKLTRLRSRHPLENLDLTISVVDNSVPEDLAGFIQRWLKETSGSKLPSDACRRQIVKIGCFVC